MDYRKEYEKWCTDPYFDEATREELLAIEKDEKEIEDRFYRTLEFGTAGLRGVIGAGTNRMNVYTVRQATQGLANYILSQKGESRGVAIAHDSRLMADEFTDAAALCLAANGIKAYVFKSLRPVPELSFALRRLGCIAGIVITASHNPREYNGYKVYWEDGAQVTPPHDGNIMEEVGKVTSFDMVKTMDKEAAVSAGLYNVIDDSVDEEYFATLRSLSIHPEIIKQMAKEIKIVYTPLHGTGLGPVQRVLKDLGFENVYIEPQQAVADGHFPTAPYPNPENPEAWTLALKLAKEKDADLVLATDPDADRLGVYCKDTKSGEYVTFTGNMSAMLIAEYILGQKAAMGTMPENPALVESIVSTDMAKAIAAEYGVELIEVLTGFKYIGEQMLKFEKTGCNNYVFGFEESYGCLPGTYARDKDAPAAVCMLCEVAAFYKSQGKTLWDGMIELYEKYGYYREGIATMTLKGIDGAAQIQEIMERARSSSPKKLGAFDVLAVRDYKADVRKDLVTGEETATGLPASNVLYYELSDNAWCCVRPSGTEPKIKFYVGVKGSSLEQAEKLLSELKEDVLKNFE
ncbi:MAG: phospho-sugar mutase [Muribaculaceae bacterium]|nr:phospho-sugar mutase [Roseburia sp.]MCM1431808.1 phospho-sugar mutase [Muribaculaceae bacterium]MCM1493489.1 phospho-sugar mutase [Muribaculaceae bacterium]